MLSDEDVERHLDALAKVGPAAAVARCLGCSLPRQKHLTLPTLTHLTGPSAAP